jgi:EAL domain-containing protein (putative c-di-GMP-specific phosphodiesterase class I)
MAPGAFISLIENTPVMLEIGQWVMESALRQMNDWLEQGLRMPLSINISAIELRNPAFPEQLRKQLKAWPKVDPSMLELEVLETAALGDLGQISRVLESCRALGVSIAIDDFGTGYSSLTYFKRLPARVVKIDQSFVSGILRDPADLAILDGIVRLADALGRDLIAEGVETHAHAEMLLRIGCNMAQGYGVARPMPASEFLPWCRQWKAPERWRHLSVIPRRALPTMYAGVDHRAWLEHFRSYIQGNEDTIELNSALCGFGVWLEKQDKESPHLSNARKLHQEVHKVAEEIHKLFLAGSHNNIPGRMKELERLSDELYHEMELLMEQTA